MAAHSNLAWIAAGEFSGDISFGGETLTSRTGQEDVFVVSFTTDAIDGRRRSEAISKTRQSTSTSMTTGTPTSRAASAAEPISTRLPPSSLGGQDGYLASYTAEGTLRWATSFGGAGLDCPSAIAVFEDSLFVAGGFEDDFEIGEEPTLESAGREDIFVAALRVR